MSLNNEFTEKLGRIENWLANENLAGLLLGTQRNFTWLSCGGSNHVGLATPDGVAFLLVTNDGRRYLLAPNNERPRLFDEEVGRFGFEPIEIPWYELRANPLRWSQAIGEIVDADRVGADTNVGGIANVEAKFAPLRYRLTEAEVERYRIHGRAVAEGVEETARAVEPGMSEREIEALLAGNLMRRGARPTVLLIAADDRFFKYRHPIPTDNRVQRYVCLSTCARLWGMIAAVTRLVHFGPARDEIERKYAALQRVEANLLAATRPGATSGELFDRLAASYAEEGYGDEWRLHHQGGATGYIEREWVATPGGGQTVVAPQAFAWNPTIAGTKVEDTIIASETGTEILTDTGSWPSVEIEVESGTLRRPQILIQ
jgi:Xaa-Pro dipeptidase